MLLLWLRTYIQCVLSEVGLAPLPRCPLELHRYCIHQSFVASGHHEVNTRKTTGFQLPEELWPGVFALAVRGSKPKYLAHSCRVDANSYEYAVVPQVPVLAYLDHHAIHHGEGE